MSALREIGVVVIGLGIAGRVRVRDLKEKTCGLRLKGVVSRRQVDLDGVPSYTMEEALSRSDVDALIISTEPCLHEDYVRRGLENGKHVLVEYPVALSSDTAKQLYQLADEKGLILHEENIALLTEGHLLVKNKAEKSQLKSGKYTIAGSYNGWLEDFDKSGLPFVTGISSIQSVLSLFGDVKVIGGKLDQAKNSYTAHADLEAQGKPMSITLSRFKSNEMGRQKHTIYEFEDGEVLDSDKLEQKMSKPGLFMRDMENFYAAILAGKIPEEQKKISIHSLEIAEKIHSFF
ncbi:biliverdin reductase A [Biomphalaria pfeifferi]|uniref:Biliverdin reductase A n=1 Tax=Biomphalaria pfeifferi TaxID=112525 RepID=A0AAD8BND3_BIOPF|nr:biliverdin reductase A [Biomphalaria pfeifferi]